MEEKILEILKITRNNAINIKDIYKKAGYTNYSYEEFLDQINELKARQLIYCVGGENYTLNPFVEGTFHIKRNGDCYVSYENKSITVNREYKKTCFEGDKVLARITDFNNNAGTIKKIIERKGIIAEVQTINKERYAVVGTNKYKIKLDDKIVDGMLIGIKIDKNKEGKYYHATLDTIIGHKNAPKLEESKILYANNFTLGFTEETLKELKYIPSSVQAQDLEGRRDLRDKMIFTIDGDDTKDIDDAISIDIEPNAIKVAYDNADLNNVDKSKYTVVSGNILSDTQIKNKILNESYNIVVSNIVADVIIGLSDFAYEALDNNGIFIASGIIKERLDEVYKKLNDSNFSVLNTFYKDDWVCVVSTKNRGILWQDFL